MSVREGYWLTHNYYRLSVEDFIDEFCGWQALKELLGHIYVERDKAFIVVLFLTGGRVSEVLQLKRENFEVRIEEGLILVKGMRLLKRYKKIDETYDKEGKRHYVTQKLIKTRKPFPILMCEPLTPILLEWLDKHEGLLFPSPYKIGEPLGYHWAYKLVRWLSDIIPANLKEKLGLQKPFLKSAVQNGKTVEIKVADEIHLWLHWFRSQRASQLVNDYGYEVIDLMNYFSWEDYKTALRYAKKGWKGLLDKMQAAQISYV